MGGFQIDIILESWRLLLQGTGVAVGVALISMVVAVILGLIVVTFRLAPVWWLRAPAFVYIQFFRGTSLYVFILWLFFGLVYSVAIFWFGHCHRPSIEAGHGCCDCTGYAQ
jgi:His/Glu/Gln/Arg/opine family amino acid ABC transporter permease subunit